MKKESDEVDDRAIVDAVAGGDIERFAILVRRHQKAVYALGYSFFRNHEDVCDFVQEVFLKVFRGLASFQGRSRFSTWLYRIAYNTAINGVRRRKSYVSLAEDLPEPSSEAPETCAIRQAAAAELRKAMGELPERYRICLDLYFFYGMSYPDIEAVTSYPVNTIKSHVFRAKEKLRGRLSDIAEGGLA